MSMDSWTEYGFGISGKKSEEDMSKGISLVRKLDPKCRKSDEELLNEFFDYNGPFSVIADILNGRNGCTGFMGVNDDENNCSGVVYSPGYPWDIEDGDRDMTADKIESILSPVAEAMGWDRECNYKEFHFIG
ncbi:MAG: hypothetical protein ACI4CS_01295 [Candidatus Weimeria sp.]